MSNMRYLPHTPEDMSAMLKTVGLDSIEGLFAHIPEDCRRREALNIPENLREWELYDHMDRLAGSVESCRNIKYAQLIFDCVTQCEE